MLCLVGLDTESMLCVRVCTYDCPQSQERMSTILLGCSLPCPANPRVPHSTGVTGTLATPSFACGCLGLGFSWLHIECSYCVRVKWTMCEGHRTFGGLFCPSAMWVLRIRLRSSASKHLYPLGTQKALFLQFSVWQMRQLAAASAGTGWGSFVCLDPLRLL